MIVLSSSMRFTSYLDIRLSNIFPLMSIIRFCHPLHSCYFLDIIFLSYFWPSWVSLGFPQSSLCHLSSPSSILIKCPVYIHFCHATFLAITITLVFFLIYLFSFVSCSLTFSINFSILVWVIINFSISLLLKLQFFAALVKNSSFFMLWEISKYF